MSTPTFLLLSLPAGALAIGLLWLIAKLLEPLLSTVARAERLKRRLERRLARGEDRYFEELRSIEAAIAANAQPGARPRGFLRWPGILFVPLAVVWLGLILLDMTSAGLGLGAPPAWTRDLSLGAMPIAGLATLLDPTGTAFGTRRSAIIVGTLFTVVGGILFAAEMWRHVTI